MAMVMISILSSPVNTTHAFPNWSFWGWILSTKFYISFPLRYKQKNHFFSSQKNYVPVILTQIDIKNHSFFFSCFSLFLRIWSCVWFRLKNQLIYSFFFYARRLNLNFSSLQLKNTQFTKTIIQRCWNN